MLELQVLLGLNCNFKCSHCLNNSFPGRRDSDLSGKEIMTIVSSVSSNNNIKSISFSGGEPLLYIKEIDEIIKAIRLVRPDFKFSITTNGSLIKKNYNAIRDLKIDYCLLSYDKEHEDFFKVKDFKTALGLAKSLFQSIEINMTYENEPQISLLKEYLLTENIKVNFNKKVISGRNHSPRNDQDSINSELRTFSPLTCPNLKTNQRYGKVTYIPKKGYSTCCGPVLFDNLISTHTSCFEDLNRLNDNLLNKLLLKFQSSELSLSSDLACHNCASIFKNFSEKELRMFLNTNSWDNLILEWNEDRLNTYNKLFNPKYVKKVEINSFQNYLSNHNLDYSSSNLKVSSGDKLSTEQIELFSEFTIDSFYKVHTKYYSSSDIFRFKKDQNIFFNLPYKYIYHTYNNKILAYFTACEIETHPVFKEKTWHIGYWGMSPILEKNDRDLVKLSWATMLQELNTKAAIGANIDYFNTPAKAMSEKFNFKTLGLRLDPRQ